MQNPEKTKRERKEKLKRKKDKGLFITFEGVEGSGKSIQAELLFKTLKEKGYKAFLTCEPGGTEAGIKIRNILLDHSNNIEPYTELFLYLADRAQHIMNEILPRLNNNEIVISDRFFDSTVAYQQYGRGISKDEIEYLRKLNIFTTAIPDITFLMDIDPVSSKKRLKEHDRIEKENIEFHRKVRNAYLELFKEYPERITKIDANNSIEHIHEFIKNKVFSYLKEDRSEEK